MRQPRSVVGHQRSYVVDHERDDPQHRAGGATEDGAEDPRHTRGDEPGQDARCSSALGRARVSGGESEERGASHLDDDIGASEQQRLAAKRLGNGDGHEQARQHQGDEHDAHARRLRVELVGEPGRVVPRPPHHEQDQRGLPRPLPAEMGQQQMRHLCNCEDKDQVVEQLQGGGRATSATSMPAGTHATIVEDQVAAVGG